jgi:hypothetical protein
MVDNCPIIDHQPPSTKYAWEGLEPINQLPILTINQIDG